METVNNQIAEVELSTVTELQNTIDNLSNDLKKITADRDYYKEKYFEYIGKVDNLKKALQHILAASLA